MGKELSIPTFDGMALNRLLRRESVDRAVRIAKIAFIIVAALLLIYAIQMIVTSTLAVHTAIDSARNQLQDHIATSSESSQALLNKKRGDYEQLRLKSPFGEIGSKTGVVEPEMAPKKVTTMALALIGTFLTPGKTPYAIIEDTKKNDQEVFNINDTIFEEATLVGIFTDRVEIRRNGQIEILKLDDAPDAEAGTGGPAGEVVTVPETDVNQALDNLPLLLTQARAVPYFKDGQAIGLRLFAIKTGSLYEKIGLRNGDILKSINGSSLGDITQAVKLFEKLREERSIALVLERNRQEQTIRYEIR